jgi:TadE-like protein
VRFLKSSIWQHLMKEQTGQAMVEAAFAIPIILLLFAGCTQLIQIGIANIVVRVAVYEGARQAHMDGGELGNGQLVAEDICKSVSSGSTEFTEENGNYTVTHHLKALLPVVKNIKVDHTCPGYVFEAGESRANDPDN